MKIFHLDRINAKAPYKVSFDDKQLVFETQYGIHYEIRFFEEQPIGGCETWQFSFAKAEDTRTPEDPYVRFTLFAVIDEFFIENENVMLYICDTSDSREAARNRLFIRCPGGEPADCKQRKDVHHLRQGGAECNDHRTGEGGQEKGLDTAIHRWKPWRTENSYLERIQGQQSVKVQANPRPSS